MPLQVKASTISEQRRCFIKGAPDGMIPGTQRWPGDAGVKTLAV
jgi:hypothetical protein